MLLFGRNIMIVNRMCNLGHCRLGTRCKRPCNPAKTYFVLNMSVGARPEGRVFKGGVESTIMSLRLIFPFSYCIVFYFTLFSGGHGVLMKSPFSNFPQKIYYLATHARLEQYIIWGTTFYWHPSCLHHRYHMGLRAMITEETN